MATNEELDMIQEKSLAFRKRLNIKGEPLENKQEPLENNYDPIEDNSYDIDLIPPDLRTKDEWAEIISEGTKSKVHFTVTMSSTTNHKFNEIMVHYQNRMPFGRVYKHIVLQMVINEAWENMKRRGLL